MKRVPTLAILALAGSLTLAGCGNSDTNSATDGGTTATDTGTPSTPATATSPTASGGSTSPSASGGLKTVPVYYVGDTADGPRLFPELRQVSASNPLAGAAALLMTGQTLDPDYRSLLPTAMGITDVGLSDGTIVVTVGPDAQITPDASTSPAEAKLAVQQLVYTFQAVSGTHDKVQVSQGSGATEMPVALLGVAATKAGAPAEPPSSVLSAVSVTSPQQGAQVTGTLRAAGTAVSFEGSVPWSLHRGGADGAVVRSGSAQAASSGSASGRPAAWSTTVPLTGLKPGQYTFTASTADPSGKGSDVTQDTKTIIVG